MANLLFCFHFETLPIYINLCFSCNSLGLFVVWCVCLFVPECEGVWSVGVEHVSSLNASLQHGVKYLINIRRALTCHQAFRLHAPHTRKKKKPTRTNEREMSAGLHNKIEADGENTQACERCSNRNNGVTRWIRQRIFVLKFKVYLEEFLIFYGYVPIFIDATIRN